MAIYNIFLDKDEYYGKNIKVKGKLINNLADIINVYLKSAIDIDEILIAGACYGKKDTEVEKLIEHCFGNGTKKRYKIGLISKYKGFSCLTTNNAIMKMGHILAKTRLKKHSDHRKMIFFLSQSELMAVLMGSSNYSPNTYLTNKSSEADLLLLKYNDGSKSKEVNNKIVSYLEYICGEDKSNDKDSDMAYILSHSIIFKSLNDNNQLDKMFDKEMQRKTIEEIVIDDNFQG